MSIWKSTRIYTLRHLELKIGFLWGSYKSGEYKTNHLCFFTLWCECRNRTKLFDKMRIKTLKWTRCDSETTKFEYPQPSHLKADLNVPPMCFLSEGLLNWHIPEYTNPQGCNKPKPQSWHYCTQISCTTCSDWSSNSYLGICSASRLMNGTCICGKFSPLQGLCVAWVRAWMSQPWHLSMTVDF